MPTLNGTEGNDQLFGTDDADTINGLGGDDLIQGGFGADELFGGEGNDTFVFTRVGSGSAQPLGRIDGGAGFDTLDLSQISGASLSGDRLQIGNQFYQLASIERVLLGSGNDAFSYINATTNLTLYGGAGNDTLAGGSGRDIFYGGEGDDQITAGEGDTAYGNDGADTLFGDQASILSGGAGDDFIRSGRGATIHGDDGNDTLIFDESSTVDGGAGDDSIRIVPSQYTYSDRFFTPRPAGTITGGAGTDTLFASTNGGPTQSASVGISLSAGAGQYSSVASYYNGQSVAFISTRYSLDSIENVSLDVVGARTVTVSGSDGANVLELTAGYAPNGLSLTSAVLEGLGGDDVLLGGVYATRLLGGDGNDLLSGSATAFYDGGAGIDTVSFAGLTSGIILSLREETISNVRDGVLETRRELLSIENVIGSRFDDVITGSDGDNIIDGGAGADAMIFTSSRADVIIAYENGRVIVTGAEGLDTLTNIEQLRFTDGIYDIDASGRFTDPRVTLVGTVEADTLTGGESNDIISGRTGDDRILGGGGNDSLYGEDGADTLYGGSGSDGLDGGDGDDVLYGEAGADRLEGRAGNDTLDGGEGADLLNGGDGNDTLLGSTGDDSLSGGSGDDVMNGGDGVDLISGGEGNDVIFASAGVDTIDGGAGIDRFVGGDTGLVIDLRQGFVREGRGTLVANLSNVENLTGGSGDDLFVGDAGANRLEGGAGRDYLSGYLGDDVLLGGDGDDQLEGGAGADQLNGGQGVDTAVFNFTYASATIRFEAGAIIVSGAEGEDRLTNIEQLRFSDRTINVGNLVVGTSGPDVLVGTAGNDYLAGGDGDDVLDGRGGADTIDGGNGRDRYLMSGLGGSIDLRATLAQTTPTGTVTLISIEDVTGTSGNDFIVGSAADNRLDGGAGDDLVSGFSGDDILTGGQGNDVIDGGGGIDTAVFSSTRAAATVTASNGVFSVVGPDGTDRVSNVEVMQFSDGAYDVVSGRLAAQSRQTLTGTAGADTLTGGESNDVLNGLDGNDILIGGMGSDTLNGGAGFDAALYSGVVRQYALQGGSATTVTGGPETGVDTLTGIEEAQFVDGILTFDVESASARVMRLYDAALDRGPDQGGLETYAAALARGTVTLQSLANAFAASAEFQSRYGNLSTQAFVEQLYRFALDRNGDPAGVQAWVNNLNAGMSRGDVLVAFSESVEHRTLTAATLSRGLWIPDADAITIARLYDATFDRLPDVGGLATWTANLKAGMSLGDIAAAFAGSAEFQSRYGALSNQAFVEQLYRFCLDRNGDPTGVQAWVGNLNSGMSRAEVLRAFSDSAEHVSLTAPSWRGGIRYQVYQGSVVEVVDADKAAHEPLTLPAMHDSAMMADMGDSLSGGGVADPMMTWSDDLFVLDIQGDMPVLYIETTDNVGAGPLTLPSVLGEADAAPKSALIAHNGDHALTLSPDGLFSDAPFDQSASWQAGHAETGWLH